MRKAIVLGAALATLHASSGARGAEPNPFGPALPPDSAERLDRDAMLGVPGSEAAILAWLVAHPDAPAATRASLQHRLCENFGIRGWLAPRARACAAEQALGPAPGAGQGASLAAILADALPIRAIGAAEVPLSENQVGTLSVYVTVEGITLPWIVDTGAEVSVLPQSSADRLGVHYLPGAVRVGTTTADVTARAAIIHVLRIGTASVENVPVLVLPDTRLRVGPPGGNVAVIPGILGLPVFVAFRHMAWTGHGTRLVLGGDRPGATGPGAPIYWHDDGMGIPVTTARGTRGALFDSGANSTYLYADGGGLPSPGELAAATRRTVHTGGAGGTIERILQELPCFSFRAGTIPVTLAHVTLTDDRDRVARIGTDFLRQFAAVALDFEHMTMNVDLDAGRAGGSACVSGD